MTLEERFWSRVAVQDPMGCWVWQGGTCEGYGMLRTEGSVVDRAHRVSWRLTHGSIPDGLCVLHRCDNPPCVNPAHLFLGTRADNNEDKKRKGRSARVHGEANPNAKLSDEDVAEIRRLRDEGRTQQAIADQFGITQVWVSQLTRGLKRAEF
jgi:hypothetical protein